MFQITNTMSKKKEVFTPKAKGEVNMYVCGITPYDFAHIGHGRCYITFDVLYRLLKFLGYDVKYARNFTDIDDKLLARAEKELGNKMEYGKVAQEYIDAYHDDMKQLNTLPPDIEPRVTEVIPEIVEFIQGLIEKGVAYEVDGDVYFSVRAFPEYGKLSKRNIDDLQSGARVDVNDKKKDPLDFALWKSEAEGTFWKSPWGYGRPGWHIECSVMASNFLDKEIDIHGGGMDLIFPHHENEVAQSEALNGCTFARNWIHNAFVQLNKEKMSKSLGNFFTLKDLFKQYDPMVVRYYILSHNYNIPLDFSEVDLKAAQVAYKRLCNTLLTDNNLGQLTDDEIKKDEVVRGMLSKLEDDLNVAGALGVLFEHLKEVSDNEQSKECVAAFIQRVLGLTLAPLTEKTVTMTPEIEQLIKDRETARTNKDWALADALRDKLKKLGVDVQDKKLN